jgi:hypothetical protein
VNAVAVSDELKSVWNTAEPHNKGTWNMSCRAKEKTIDNGVKEVETNEDRNCDGYQCSI